MSWLTGWRVPLRMARRDALRSRARSVLVLVMIALPVLAVSAADIVIQTQDVSGVESLDRRLGSASASVSVQRGITTVVQAPDPMDGSSGEGERGTPRPSADEISRLLGGARLVEQRSGSTRVVTRKGETDAEAIEVDLADPVAEGLFRLTSGRLPAGPGEVVVNRALADRGYGVGDVLETAGDDTPDPTVVGFAESSAVRDHPVVAGPVGSLDLTTYGATTWLVDGGPVSWSAVRELNAHGATVVSRAVVSDPPAMPPEMREYVSQSSGDVVAVIVLIVVMALLEVVLLAGPAFAVGARRQARSLALMASAGGTPAQARRVVLAGAVVLGGVASLLGVVSGIVVARVLVPVVQQRSGSWFGPFDVPWLHLVGVAVLGLLSALLAAFVPATIASRQDVVAVLAGRRGDRKPSVRSPILGVVLLAAGVAGAAVGARTSAVDGASFIAGAAIASVLGMILLVPVVLALVSRVSARLPLTLRYAARDAARHRTRTVPAVAAVAATVAGVVALGIATSSDEKQNEAGYTPTYAAGVGVATGSGDFTTYARLVQREIPGATVTPVRGVAPPEDGFNHVSLTVAGDPADDAALITGYGSSFGSDVLVSDGPLPAGLLGLDADGRRSAEDALAAGRIVAFTDTGSTADRLLLQMRSFGNDGRRMGPAIRAVVPVVVVSLSAAEAGPQAIVPPEVADRLAIPVDTVGLTVSGTAITRDQESAVEESLAGVSDTMRFSVERGYQADDETVIIQLVLAGLGAILMLGGTLTATFLALSDARPDLATLAAVGASPRRRRGIAAAYALVVGVVGALLGVVVGFIPGIAIAYPLTVLSGGTTVVQGDQGSTYATASGVTTGPYIDVPWLLILGLVVVLPLLTALVVGATVRSRLPLVARLD